MKFTATLLLLFIFVLMVDLGEGRRKRRRSKRKWLRRIGKDVRIIGGAALDSLNNGQDYGYQQELNKRSDDDSPSLMLFD